MSAPGIGAMADELRPYAGPEGSMATDNPVMQQARSMWRELRSGKTFSHTEKRQMLVYFGITQIRDRLLSDLIDPTITTLTEFEDVFLGLPGKEPDRVSLAQTGILMVDLAETFDEDIDDIADVAPILTSIAWVLWMSGADNQKVASALQVALRADRNYVTANLLATFIVLYGQRPRWMSNS